MKLPTNMRPGNVKVGALSYAILTDAALLDSDDYGEFRPQAGTIAVCPHLSGHLEREVLWHEIKHAVAFAAGFRDSDKKYPEEEYVTRTAGLEIQVLRENPALVEYLTK